MTTLPSPNLNTANIAPEGHVSPETEQVSSPGSASSTHLEEHDEEDFDDDDDDDDDDAAAAAIDTQIQASDHEEVPIETVLPPKRPANTTYDAIVASEGKIVEAENRRHSDLMTVLERMIALQEETVSQLAHLHRVFIEVPKQLQKINTSFEALVVQQTQANYWRMTNVPQFNTSQPGSVHAGQFSPHSSDIHSPGPNVTGQVADIAVQVPDDILLLPSVQIQQQTPTKEATKTKQDTHETDQPSLVQCLPTCSHVAVRNLWEAQFGICGKRSSGICGKRSLEFVGSAVREFVGSAVWNLWEAQFGICGKRSLEFVGSAVRNLWEAQFGICGKRSLEFVGSAVRDLWEAQFGICGKRSLEFVGSAVRNSVSQDDIAESV
ncbi:uncharacterized protein LOC142503307 [Ascaphus truei]|uniref:uncharacterized protein LOC142503307 n=1 Tax=Ascaphus truei TaxID=8439 RepID=UPI003F5A3DDF